MNRHKVFSVIAALAAIIAGLMLVWQTNNPVVVIREVPVTITNTPTSTETATPVVVEVTREVTIVVTAAQAATETPSPTESPTPTATVTSTRRSPTTTPTFTATPTATLEPWQVCELQGLRLGPTGEYCVSPQGEPQGPVRPTPPTPEPTPIGCPPNC